MNRRIRRINGYDVNRMPVEGETLIGLNNLPRRFVFNGMQYKTDNNLSEFYLKDSHLTISNLIREDGSKALQRCLFPEDIQLQGFHNESGKSRWLKDNEIHAVDFGYAITVHKSQGSSYKRPVIFEEYLGDKAFHRRWLYTAVTRAVKKVFIVTPNR